MASVYLVKSVNYRQCRINLLSIFRFSTSNSKSEGRPNLQRTWTSETSSNSSDVKSSFISSFESMQYFDTLRFVKRLEKEGFNQQQASAIMSALREVIQQSLDSIKKNAVTLDEQEKYSFQYKADFAQLKSEVHMAEKNDFAILKADNERLSAELDKLRERMREEINKVQAGFRLDMSLEKGRIRDETAQQEVKIQETDNRIKQEMFNFRAQMETLKFDIVKYVIGTIGTTGALFLGYLRLFK